MDGYFERFGGVRDYLRDVVAEARGTGYTATMFGRRRYLPDLTSDNRQRREMAERMALNAPIQGSAADIMKVAMIGVDRALTAAGAKSRILLQVHDELVLEIAAGERDDVEKLVRARDGPRRRDGRARSTSTSGWGAPGTTPPTEAALPSQPALGSPAGHGRSGGLAADEDGRAGDEPARAAATSHPTARRGRRATPARRGRRARARRP